MLAVAIVLEIVVVLFTVTAAVVVVVALVVVAAASGARETSRASPMKSERAGAPPSSLVLPNALPVQPCCCSENC